MLKFVIPRSKQKSLYVDEDMHLLLKVYARKKRMSLQLVTRELLKAGILADEEFSGDFKKTLKRLGIPI